MGNHPSPDRTKIMGYGGREPPFGGAYIVRRNLQHGRPARTDLGAVAPSPAANAPVARYPGLLREILGFAQASQQHGLAEAASCQIAWQLDEYCLTVQEKGEWVAA
jgi:hypothetical protein